MPVNSNKPELWKADIEKSVDMYNRWFMSFAPKAFRETRVQATEDVKEALNATKNLARITTDVLKERPDILPAL